jgi:hypothetical protein
MTFPIPSITEHDPVSLIGKPVRIMLHGAPRHAYILRMEGQPPCAVRAYFPLLAPHLEPFHWVSIDSLMCIAPPHCVPAHALETAARFVNNASAAYKRADFERALDFAQMSQIYTGIALAGHALRQAAEPS